MLIVARRLKIAENEKQFTSNAKANKVKYSKTPEAQCNRAVE